MLDLTNQNIDEFAAAFAHEVKNPVSLIRANLDFLQTNSELEKYGSNIQVMKRELTKISKIVTDFIQLAKPVEEIDKEIIFINDLISDIIEDYDISLKDKNISFSLKAADKDISIMGDYSKICILFFNIFKNAVEAVDDYGEIITHIYKADKHIIVDISDNGSGISGDIIDKLGQPFVTTKKDGSGLGILICKSIAGEHNAVFELKNNENRPGCCARVIFENLT